MGRKRKVVYQKKTESSDYDSDNERAYKKMPVPDPNAQDFFMDEVDEFNENRDKILLERDNVNDGDSDTENQEEIFSLDYSDSDDDIEEKLRHIKTQQHLEEIASDIEDEEGEGEEARLPDAKAWGKRKKEFYHTDYVDDDLPGVSGSDEDEAQDEEEREALAIQKRMSQMMQETDFDVQFFQASAKSLEKKTADSDNKAEERVIKDLSKLSKRDKLEILKKESPEFLELVEDFKVKMKTVIDTLYPLLGLMKNGQIPQGPGTNYISTRFQLYMNYCVNISFYMTLKAKHVAVHNHPVISRILAYKKLIKELEPLDMKLEPEMKELLTTQQDQVKGNSKKSSGSPCESSEENDSEDDDKDILTRNVRSKVTPKDVQKTKKSSLKKGSTVSQTVTGNGQQAPQKHVSNNNKTENTQEIVGLKSDEQKAFEYYEKMAKEIEDKKMEKRKQMKELSSKDEVTEVVQEEELEDGKRAITYQISKNKGLTPHRKKEQRNPRVKYKMKYKRAKVRRKGQVREVRKELVRYGGEVSGIRAGVIKSVKIK